MKGKRSIAFIVELFLLFGILLVMIVVITQVFVTTRSQSLHAKHLTAGVCLAEEVAEVFSSADNVEEGYKLVETMDRVSDVETAQDGIRFVMESDAGEKATDHFHIQLKGEEVKQASGGLLSGDISVYYEEEKDPIYSLSTGVLIKEGTA